MHGCGLTTNFNKEMLVICAGGASFMRFFVSWRGPE